MLPYYYSYNEYMTDRFGEKVYKLSLDGGMTCPNRDGTVGTGGCIFCSEGGSGDFAERHTDDIDAQIERAKAQVSKKYRGNKFVAYFQSYTNTYAPVSYLRKIFFKAVNHPEIVALSIATRPDCLGEDVLDLLKETGMTSCKAADTPIKPNVHLKTAATNEVMDKERYQR